MLKVTQDAAGQDQKLLTLEHKFLTFLYQQPLFQPGEAVDFSCEIFFHVHKIKCTRLQRKSFKIIIKVIYSTNL